MISVIQIDTNAHVSAKDSDAGTQQCRFPSFAGDVGTKPGKCRSNTDI